MRLPARWSRSKRILLLNPLHPCSSQNPSRKLLSWSTWRTHVEYGTSAPTVAQAAPMTTSTVAPTVFPTRVPIATVQIASGTMLKTLQLRNSVCHSQRKLHRKQMRFHRSDTLTKLWVCQLWINAKHRPSTEQKTTDVPRIRCFEPLVDVPVVTQQTAEIPVVMLKQLPVMMRRQIPLVQKMVEVPQIQHIDNVVDAPVSMQREVQVQEQSDGHGVTTGVSLNTSVAMAPHRKRKGSDIFLSPRLKAGMKERAQDDDHEHETLCASIASADEIAPVHCSLCDGTELETRPKGEHEGATARQVDDILLEMKNEVLHGKELIGVLVRKERCAETSAQVGTRAGRARRQRKWNQPARGSQ